MCIRDSCKTDQYRCELPLDRCYLLAHPLQLEILQFPVKRDHCNQVYHQKQDSEPKIDREYGHRQDVRGREIYPKEQTRVNKDEKEDGPVVNLSLPDDFRLSFSYFLLQIRLC